jgi:glutamate-1-semialdehyde 2,1-aminomutase
MATLQDELTAYQARTAASRRAHERALASLPLGVGSNFRYYEPYPLFVAEAQGVRLVDLDGHEYLDFNLCFGALMAGHCHPALQRAVQERLGKGTMFGMPHELEAELAEEICRRFPVEQVRFGNSGTEVSMHALRLARGFTGRDKVVKVEGAYHGVHDTVMVSVKPKREQAGDPQLPNPVPAGQGIPAAAMQNTLVVPFNKLAALEQLFERHRGEIAAVIVEPILMNIGICLPMAGYLQAVARLCAAHGTLFILDEVKTGVKLAWGGACEYFGLKPDLVCLAKSIGGGLPLAAFGGRREVMKAIADGRVFHAGTYNTNPLAMAAGLATLREVLRPEVYPAIQKLNEKLLAGYRQQVARTGLDAYVVGAGANGALMLAPRVVENYRDWLEVDQALWRHYWFGMINRGVMAQPYWWDEQWTLSVAHTEEDIQHHLDAFADLVPDLAQAQKAARASVA